ncbi:RNA polymerase sigma factor [Pseudosporangium ferrugineum]|uniref:RNA polymerase sigma-70 factor (ECF subfamily) n=1 Tax=Pseudosporangium ferrugineum TaxID=439699 RepID=A0A2T0SJ03_9ACTN|nr:sigma-70 family RNA polymerase sigma factor [Pseudosporangium ferrugineum]PRY33384.1 RNA polymerase sigma-70 factor (ECF subfamily) [Pseudosporangium ferrugineum]
MVDAQDAHDVGSDHADTASGAVPRGSAGDEPVPARRLIPDPPPAAEIEEFFRRYWEGLVRNLLREGANRWEAQDAVAEAIREALRRWPELTHPVAWVRTAARSHWLKQRRAIGQGDLEVLVADVTELDEARADDPELVAYELEEWFSGVLAQLPPARREALELSAQGLTPTEIAARVGKSPEAVRTALKLGRKQAVALWQAIPGQRTGKRPADPEGGEH